MGERTVTLDDLTATEPSPASSARRSLPRVRRGLQRVISQLRLPGRGPVQPEEPCIPCGDHRGVRQFSIDADSVGTVLDSDLPRPTPGVLHTVLDDHIVLLIPDREVTHVLNPSASLIWLTIDGSMTVADVIDSLHRETGVERSVLDHDVRRAVSTFHAAGIVTMASLPDSSGSVPAPARPRRHPRQDRLLNAVKWRWQLGPVVAATMPMVLRANASDVGDRLHQALGALPEPTGNRASATRDPVVISVLDAGHPGPRRYRVFVDNERRWNAALLDDLVRMVTTGINQLAVDNNPDHVLFHAGAVERDGKVIVIAGDSGRGKSTLTAALVQDGFSYLTDEMVALDPTTLAVVPYPKAVDLDDRARSMLGLDRPDPGPDGRPAGAEVDAGLTKTGVTPSRLGSLSAGGRLALFVLLVGETSGEPLTVTTGAPASVTTLVELIGTVFRPSFDDPRAFDLVAHLHTLVPVSVLPRTTLDDARLVVRAEFERLS